MEQRCGCGTEAPGVMSYALSSDSPWMSVAEAAGVVTGAARRARSVSFRGLGLSEGVYTGVIASEGAANDPFSVPVHLAVRPSLAVSPTC